MYTITLCVLAIGVFLRYCYATCKDGTIVANNLTSAEKQKILDLHNYYRNNVAGGKITGQPGAEDMIEMVWDDELASMAQEWSDNCIFAHNSYEDRTTSDGTAAGQNLGIHMTTAKTCDPNALSSIVDSWFNEVESYTFSNRQSSETGHYTQLIWANSVKIGCGYTVFKKNGWMNCYLACNYSPPGNYVGQYPYSPGKKSCRANRLVDSKKYKYLCAA